MPGTITVASKLQCDLKIFTEHPKDIKEKTIYGPIESKQWIKEVTPFAVIKGVSKQADKAPRAPMTFSFALTHGVDAEKFENWIQKHADDDCVKNGYIYAAAKMPDVEAHCKLYQQEKTGMEPIDPDNLPNEFKRKIATASSAV